MGSRKSVTVDEWVKRCTDKHGDMYSYPVELWGDKVRATDKVPFICAEHGVFYQQVRTHVKSEKPCSICANKGVIPYGVWVDKFKSVHSDKYEYPYQAGVIKSTTTITVKCKEHGNFATSVRSMYSGVECCNECKTRPRKTMSQWIGLAEKVHRDEYTYVENNVSGYVPNDDKISIVCKEHGVFHQTLKSHVTQESKCPTCSNFDQRYLYIHDVGGQALKYGVTNSVSRRMYEQQLKCIYLIKNMAVYEFIDAKHCLFTEKQLKKTNQHVLDRTEMEDGWTETCLVENYPALVKEIEFHGGRIMTKLKTKGVCDE